MIEPATVTVNGERVSLAQYWVMVVEAELRKLAQPPTPTLKLPKGK